MRVIKRIAGVLRTILEILLEAVSCAWNAARRHRRASVTALLAFVLACFGVWQFAGTTAKQALREEREFWAKARALTLEERTMIRNHMVRTGRVPHLLPWWEMDTDRCAAVAWKFVNLLSGVQLTHGDNGAAWMLRRQNESKLRTIWDGTERFKDGELGERFEPTIEELRSILEGLQDGGLYMAGFRWTNTSAAEKIERDRADINSHVVVITGGMIFHMIHTDSSIDPIIMDHQENFFYWRTMQPVWLAEVMHNGKPFRFAPTTKMRRLEQRVFPWKSLRRVLYMPDFAKGVNALERCILHWFRNGYDMYPHL